MNVFDLLGGNYRSDQQDNWGVDSQDIGVLAVREFLTPGPEAV